MTRPLATSFKHSDEEVEMLHTELLRLINTRETWVLVGSGASIDAGCPTWDQLLSIATKAMQPQQLASFKAQTAPLHEGSVGASLPYQFSLAETILGRQNLVSAVSDELHKNTQPGSLHKLLADLPFAGYITTNYDHLLETALNAIEPGWASVGNVGDEVQKASGTAERVVWHVHGGIALPTEKSRLVLTTNDYDEIYVDESRVIKQLRGILANRRIAIVGFGFRDDDVMRLLKSVGRLTDATRPIFALVEKNKDFRHTADRAVFLRQYKIDVQPYKNTDGRHQDLRHTLSVYSSLSLRRSLRYGRHLTAPPSYDPETTGLLIYNDLVLKNPQRVPEELKIAILKARILSLCRSMDRKPEELRSDLDVVIDALTRRVTAPAKKEETDLVFERALTELQTEGLLEISASDRYSLSPAGRSTVLDHSAAAERMDDQFQASIRTRVEKYSTALMTASERPSQIVASFFASAIEKRALGVALTFATGGTPSQQEYHALALLQSLGDFLDTADSPAQALVVIQVIQEIFQGPTDAENQYIAAAVQARFMLHLLSLDEGTLTLRRAELQESLVVIDSSTLIAWLAKGSAGHKGASSLLEKLKAMGVSMAATAPLVEEVAEHARWVQKEITASGGAMTPAVLSAATGRAGVKTNAFLEGYLASYGSAISSSPFNGYLRDCLDRSVASDFTTEADIAQAASSHGISLIDVSTLATKDTKLAGLIDRYLKLVRSSRESGGSFKHERQVRAEAEVIALIERIRATEMELHNKKLKNAYFISNSSFLNKVSLHPTAVTMRPEAALAWLATLIPMRTEDSRAMISELLWELQERRMNLVDKKLLLETFGPLIVGARQQLEQLIPQYQALMASRYAGDAFSSMESLPELDIPVILEGLATARMQELEKELQRTQVELRDAAQRAELSDNDRKELAEVRRNEAGRKKYENRMRRRKKKG